MNLTFQTKKEVSEDEESVEIEDDDFAPSPRRTNSRKNTDNDELIAKMMAEEEEHENGKSDDDEDHVEVVPKKTRSKPTIKPKPPAKKQTKKKSKPKKKVEEEVVKIMWDEESTKKLDSKYPDAYWMDFFVDELEGSNGKATKITRIDYLNEKHPIANLKTLDNPGAVYSARYSPSYQLFATCTNLGVLRIWDATDYSLIAEIRDHDEPEIEEFYTFQWSESSKYIICGGKLKSRSKWSDEEEDNAIMQCPLKVFDVFSGNCVMRQDGAHGEEILALKRIRFKDSLYIVSCGEDGAIKKWKFKKDLNELDSFTEITEEQDPKPSIVSSINFVPNCGNKYMVATCDGGVQLYDFEDEVMLMSWPNLYSSICDCAKFIHCKEIEAKENEFYLMTKGVEIVAEEGEPQTPNKLTLYKVTLPESREGDWGFSKVRTFNDSGYVSNIWLTKFASNGRYLAAPTQEGKVFVWNLASGELTCVLKGHEREIRDIVFHPFAPYFITCGEDTKVNIYKPEEFVK